MNVLSSGVDPSVGNVPASMTAEPLVPTFGFAPPNELWCPWRSETCTHNIGRRGQMTIEMDQTKSLPFELFLSISDQPTNETYGFHLSVNVGEVLITKMMNGVRTIINRTNDHHSVLNEHQGKR